MQKHEFAIYFEFLKNIKEGYFILSDTEIVHRIVAVLRFKEGDRFILFNKDINILCTIDKILNKKALELLVIAVQQNKKLLPEVTWALPILKRDHFEEAIYSLVELGIKYIQPIITSKSSNWFGKEKDVLRCNKIIISACEQSKNFDVPILLPTLKFDDWLNSVKNLESSELFTKKIFFDADGLKADIVLKNIDKNLNIICCSGPESDLDISEKNSLVKANFQLCKLTPTILRAQQAIVVGLGLIKSLG